MADGQIVKNEKQSNDGSFKRKDTELRNWITPDGSPGETGVAGAKQRVVDTICMSLWPVLWPTEP